ncbi:MAG: fibrobacter succinogenes major paralogous domain-containing protein [Saprospiraceae bacterium]|nr:fibrobacter succinogenes major paralogous domain-containing protein [Saprospiraceae bacterium]
MVIKYTILTLSILAAFLTSGYTQEKLVIEGAVTLANSDDTTPEAGTIRWTGSDFEGWTGSKWVSLTSGTCGGLTFVSDVDANRYRVVAIGTQCWTTENLRVQNFNDGSPIPLIPVATDWATITTPPYSWYNDNMMINAVPFGALYNWYAVDTASNGNKNICPFGWHMPTEQDYQELINYLGGESVAGIDLKEAGNVHFLTNNETATNLSGFTAIPGGYRTGTSFYEKGYYAQYWTVAAHNATQAKFVDIEYDGEYADIANQNKNRGNSVRCVKD